MTRARILTIAQVLTFVLFVASVQGVGGAAPVGTGMVADASSHNVTIFDMNTYKALGSVRIPNLYSLGDCVISGEAKLGFVSDRNSNLWVIDLQTISLASGIKSIGISNSGQQLTITPDRKFLLACAGYSQPISVVRIEDRTEIGSYWRDLGVNSLDVGADGTVLATSYNDGTVCRLTIDSSGNLTDTGERLDLLGLGLGWGVNVYIAPSCTSGIVMDYYQTLQSFTVPGLAPVSTVFVLSNSGLINPAGDLVYVRTDWPYSVAAYAFNSTTGVVGAQVRTFPAGTYWSYVVHNMVLDPDESRLYLSDTTTDPAPAVKVYNGTTGSLLDSITDLNIVTPTGVCIAPGVVPPVVECTLSDEVLMTFAETLVSPPLSAGLKHTEDVEGPGVEYDVELVGFGEVNIGLGSPPPQPDLRAYGRYVLTFTNNITLDDFFSIQVYVKTGDEVTYYGSGGNMGWITLMPGARANCSLDLTSVSDLDDVKEIGFRLKAYVGQDFGLADQMKVKVEQSVGAEVLSATLAHSRDDEAHVENPVDTDSDGDGMPDVWEEEHGLDPMSNDADGDHDADGQTNYAECVAGTSPDDPCSVFAVASPRIAGEEYVLTWTSVPGRLYRLWHSDDVVIWAPVSNWIPANQGEMTSWRIPVTPAERRGYYRVEILR